MRNHGFKASVPECRDLEDLLPRSQSMHHTFLNVQERSAAFFEDSIRNADFPVTCVIAHALQDTVKKT